MAHHRPRLQCRPCCGTPLSPWPWPAASATTGSGPDPPLFVALPFPHSPHTRRCPRHKLQNGPEGAAADLHADSEPAVWPATKKHYIRRNDSVWGEGVCVRTGKAKGEGGGERGVPPCSSPGERGGGLCGSPRAGEGGRETQPPRHPRHRHPRHRPRRRRRRPSPYSAPSPRPRPD